ncbi:MAG TPA: trimethylamine methyltransferase family protein [Desulfosarcina sp.]|nr:trimethylamine methyltransferase family protein [Desulfosarcina sp.]
MPAKLTAIHNQALAILATVGINLHHVDVCEMVRRHGATIRDKTAYFPPDLVMDQVRRAPEAFTLHARNSRYDMRIGGDQVHCAPGYGCAAICDTEGRRRMASMADYVRFAKMVHQSPHFKINGGILAQPADMPPGQSHLLMLYAAMLCSDKCLLGIPAGGIQMQTIMEMGKIVFGGSKAFAARPHILTLISTLSPLQIDETALGAMLVAARHNQPLIISPSPATGTTGPIDMAANISLATAEALAAIAIVQMVNPGTPVIFGLQCLGADLRTGNISMGSPAYTLQSKYTAALARMYGLPCRCGGALTDALHPGVQSGYESMLNLVAAYVNGVNLVVHSAGTLDSVAALSYDKFIADLEIIDMVRYYLQELVVDHETLNLALIRSVGPGGQFLNTIDALRKCRSHTWDPPIGVRGYIRGQSAAQAYATRIADRQRQMLTDYAASPPAMDRARLEQLNALLHEQGIDAALLDSIRRLAATVQADEIT